LRDNVRIYPTVDISNKACIVCRRVGSFPSCIRDVGVVGDLAMHGLDVMRFIPMPVSDADDLTALRLALAMAESGKTQRVIEVGA
jgi:hypothetical protein